MLIRIDFANLNVSSNCLNNIPTEVGQLRNLVSLNMIHMKWKVFHRNDINAGYNSLSAIPHEIGSLNQLQFFKVLLETRRTDRVTWSFKHQRHKSSAQHFYYTPDRNRITFHSPRIATLSKYIIMRNNNFTTCESQQPDSDTEWDRKYGYAKHIEIKFKYKYNETHSNKHNT